jgi:6-phosphogluconolactonase (cycloisomerase 2 family)
MKFTKIGKALLSGALSIGVVFGVSSCIRSYSVGYLYITTTVTAQPAGAGLITGYKIDHNTGQLNKINGLPVSSGGANPVRAVLTQGSRFLYVLNRGSNAAGTANCTTLTPCQNANITQFAVGGNGIVTPQQTFFTQGNNPFRLIVDSTGTFLMVLDHDATNPAACQAALGVSVTTCGDITVFSINSTTGRLSLVQNQQVTLPGGAALNYFPVPANSVDFVLTASNIITLSGPNAQLSYPYTGGSRVFPYSFNSSTGQLTLNQNTTQPLGIGQGNAIVLSSGNVYVLNNEPISYSSNGTTTTAQSQILPYTVSSTGSLQAQTGGTVPDDPTLSNPIYLMTESKGKYVYVANQGNNTTGTNNPSSGLAGYFMTTTPAFQLSFIAGQPFGTGSGPQCLVEDPSDQYIYTANQYDSTVTGRLLDPNSGTLNQLRVPNSTALPGPATWCLINGRTN